MQIEQSLLTKPLCIILHGKSSEILEDRIYALKSSAASKTPIELMLKDFSSRILALSAAAALFFKKSIKKLE